MEKRDEVHVSEWTSLKTRLGTVKRRSRSYTENSSNEKSGSGRSIRESDESQTTRRKRSEVSILKRRSTSFVTSKNFSLA